MRARRYGLRLAACALLAVAGCGGGGPKPPTAAEIEAADQRWRDRVNEVCFEVNRALGRRGRPARVAGLGETVAEGVTDVRAAIRRIAAVPGGSRAPAAFVRELKTFDAELAALPGGGADMEPAALVRAADQLKPRLTRLNARAGEAGLTNCMSHKERELVPDAVRSPIFVERLERHDRRFVQRLPVGYDEPASTEAELADRIEALGEVLDGLVADAATFDPPDDAANATRGYLASARRLLNVVRRYEAFLRDGGLAAPAAGFRRHRRAFSRTYRETSRASTRMRSRAGVPAPPADADAESS